MASAPYPHSPYGRQTPLSRRATGLILALTVDALIILALLSLSSSPPPEPDTKGGPITVRLLSNAPASPTQTKKASKQERSGEKAMTAATEIKRPAPRDSLVKPPPPIDEHDLGMLVLTREQFAASDIGKMTAPARTQGGSKAGNSMADNSVFGRGRGPNGERLFRAEWYRKPTDAELSFYLPARMPRSGTALIACRTIERYRVDDCIEIGDYPRGSGLARAVREAAWQFMVIPPRVGGKTMVGAWVSIEYEFTERGARTADR